MTPLCELAEKYGTDKFSKHRYTPVYFKLLSECRESVRRVLEIGIKRGASLRMWEEFFPFAEIIGIDIKTKNLINEGRIKSFHGDQSNEKEMRKFGKAHGPFDLIVDDGKHKAKFQLPAAMALLPCLSPSGTYVIEDVRQSDEREVMNQIAAARRYYCRMFVSQPQSVTNDSRLIIVRLLT